MIRILLTSDRINILYQKCCAMPNQDMVLIIGIISVFVTFCFVSFLVYKYISNKQELEYLKEMREKKKTNG